MPLGQTLLRLLSPRSYTVCAGEGFTRRVDDEGRLAYVLAGRSSLKLTILTDGSGASLESLRSAVSLPHRRAVSLSISAVNQWRFNGQLRHFPAELRACIAGTSSPLNTPSDKSPDVVRGPENSKHPIISRAAK
jgi:hypothetical protein